MTNLTDEKLVQYCLNNYLFPQTPESYDLILDYFEFGKEMRDKTFRYCLFGEEVKKYKRDNLRLNTGGSNVKAYKMFNGNTAFRKIKSSPMPTNQLHINAFSLARNHVPAKDFMDHRKQTPISKPESSLYKLATNAYVAGDLFPDDFESIWSEYQEDFNKNLRSSISKNSEEIDVDIFRIFNLLGNNAIVAKNTKNNDECQKCLNNIEACVSVATNALGPLLARIRKKYGYNVDDPQVRTLVLWRIMISEKIRELNEQTIGEQSRAYKKEVCPNGV